MPHTTRHYACKKQHNEIRLLIARYAIIVALRTYSHASSRLDILLTAVEEFIDLFKPAMLLVKRVRHAHAHQVKRK
jgi:hypothetical protein